MKQPKLKSIQMLGDVKYRQTSKLEAGKEYMLIWEDGSVDSWIYQGTKPGYGNILYCNFKVKDGTYVSLPYDTVKTIQKTQGLFVKL